LLLNHTSTSSVLPNICIDRLVSEISQ
jgi:hypothetical protein